MLSLKENIDADTAPVTSASPAIPLGVNPYIYALNHPTQMTDITGLQTMNIASGSEPENWG